MSVRLIQAIGIVKIQSEICTHLRWNKHSNTHGRNVNATTSLAGDPQRAHLKIWLQIKLDLGAAQSGDVHWIYLAQVGSRGWPCEQGSEPSGSIKEMEFLG